MTSPQIAEWLAESLCVTWQTEFGYMMNLSTYQEATKSSSGLSFFIQGLHMEHGKKDAAEALKLYEAGASKLDPLCLYKLHEVYLGSEFFKTQLNVDKSLIYLVFGGLYSQDIPFEGSVVPYKKLKTFLNEFDAECEVLEEVFQRAKIETIEPFKTFTLCLLFDFQSINSELSRNSFLEVIEDLDVNVQHKVMFTLYLAEFRLPWTFAVKRKENLVLKLMQNDDVFSGFFEGYLGLIQLAMVNKDIGAAFYTWIQTVLFVIDFVNLSDNRNKYCQSLIPFVSQALENSFLEGKDMQCWLRYFLAYCYEQGISVAKNLKKALALIQKNIEMSPEGVMYPLREAIILKQLDDPVQSNNSIRLFEDLYDARIKQSENSLLCYAKGKSYEKYYEDRDAAIKYYTKGSAELQEDAPQRTFLFYSYWRVRCLRKLEKLKNRPSPSRNLREEVLMATTAKKQIFTSTRADKGEIVDSPGSEEKSFGSANLYAERQQTVRKNNSSTSSKAYEDIPTNKKTQKEAIPVKNTIDRIDRNPSNYVNTSPFSLDTNEDKLALGSKRGTSLTNTSEDSQPPSKAYNKPPLVKSVSIDPQPMNNIQRKPSTSKDTNEEAQRFNRLKNNRLPSLRTLDSQRTYSEAQPQGQLYQEGHKAFDDLGVKVFDKKLVRMGSVKSNGAHVAVINDVVYYADEAKLENVEDFNQSMKLVGRTFTPRGSKILIPEGVVMKEKADGLFVNFLTPLTELDLDRAIKRSMLPDIKTKLHISMQIAVCLFQVYETEQPNYYGTLRPTKVLLDDYFSASLYSSSAAMLPYKKLQADGFTAPEQLKGEHSQKSDVWALGIILLELFYDEGLTQNKMNLDNLYKGQYIRGKDVAKPIGLDELVDEMVEYNPTNRPDIKRVYEELKSKSF